MRTKKTIHCLEELPTCPVTVDSMAWNKTGDWRYLTPVLEDKAAPCRQACPLGQPIPEIIKALKEGDTSRALKTILAVNPLPGLTGRLCYHPCQTDCLRRALDGPVTIQMMEAYLSAMTEALEPKETKHPDLRIAVWGAGPIGLACAYFLSRAGYRVTLIPQRRGLGGLLTARPDKRLAPDILESEISRLMHMAGLAPEPPRETIRDGAAYDLLIWDPSGGDDETLPDFRAARPEMKADNVIEPVLPEKIRPYKPAWIAHYTAAGRNLAREALERLSGAAPAIDEGAELKAVDREKIRLERFSPAPRLEAARGDRPTEDQVVAEAGRCLSCGTCNACLVCVDYCPDASIRPDSSGRPRVDLYHCKGCGICARECPRGVITMEDIQS